MDTLKELATRIMDLGSAFSGDELGLRIEAAKIADEVLNLDRPVQSELAVIGSDRPWEKSQRNMIFGLLGTIGIVDDEARHDLAGQILGRTVDTFTDLTYNEASLLIDALTHIEVYVDGAAS